MNRRTFLKCMMGIVAYLASFKFSLFKVKNSFANEGKEIKKLGFGFMRLPEITEGSEKKIDIEQVKKMVDKFLEDGFTYFDTAWMYMGSKSEETIKKTLVKRHKREEFQLATKLPMMYLNSKEDQEKIFNKQLENCGVSYFDYYLLHNLNISNYDTAKNFESFKFIAQKKKEGKIKHIGFSFHDSANLLETILKENPEVEFVQLQINYIDWDNPAIQSRLCYEVAKKYNKKVIVMEPVKGGMLVNIPKEGEDIFKSINPKLSNASWAIRYAASLPQVLVVLSGMSNMEQLLDNTSYMKDFAPLNEKENEAIRKVVNILKNQNSIACTACKYCVSDCPKKIPIPDYFALYNADIMGEVKGFSIQKLYYNNLSKDKAKASECIKCKKCESLCPQHIKISEKLVDVAKHFEG